MPPKRALRCAEFRDTKRNHRISEDPSCPVRSLIDRMVFRATGIVALFLKRELKGVPSLKRPGGRRVR